MFRRVAVSFCIRKGITLKDLLSLIVHAWHGASQKIFLDIEEVNELIRLPWKLFTDLWVMWTRRRILFLTKLKSNDILKGLVHTKNFICSLFTCFQVVPKLYLFLFSLSLNTIRRDFEECWKTTSIDIHGSKKILVCGYRFSTPFKISYVLNRRN